MATIYWVGGTGTWDAVDTTHWSASSGGAGGASVPGSGDYVIIDASSGGGLITIDSDKTIQGFDIRGFTGTFDFSTFILNVTGNASTTVRQDSTATISGTKIVNFTYAGSTGTRTIGLTGVTESNALTVNVTAGTDIVTTTAASVFKSLNFTGFSGTLSNTTKTIYGNLTISSGMTLTAGTSATTFGATSGTQQITTNGVTLDFPLTFNGVGGTFQLQDNCTVGSTRTVTLTNGALDLNNNTLSCGIFSSNNSNTRSIAFGTGNITLTGSGATIWVGTGSTYTAIGISGTPTVNCTYSGSTGTRTISGGARTVLTESQVFNFNITAGSDTVSFPAANAYGNLDFTGFTGALTTGTDYFYGNVKLASGQTWTASTSAITFAATSAKQITTAGLTIDVPLNFNGIGGTWSFADALTQGSTKAFTIANGIVKLKAGVTSTVGAFATSGSNQKYLQSTTAGSQATLSQTSGIANLQNVNAKDINATGGAAWNLVNGSVNDGNLTGWYIASQQNVYFSGNFF